jgi:Tc5 transposase DNA-binding domain
VAYINKLSDRGLPSTPGIVRNLARELFKTEVGEHWVSRFCRRHKNELSSVYLRAIDYKRKVADNSLYFKHYFKLVSL